MSTVIANSITSLDGGAVNTHISEDTEFVSEGGATTLASSTLTLGLIKEYLTCYFQNTDQIAPDQTFATLNVSSISDTSTGRIQITHVNNYNATDTYQAYPNTGNYGKTFIDCNATNTADMYDHGEDNSVSDMIACFGFSGELA